jgi:2-polyprenyl-3-methyl-5-hydroxy-6-metoxy-1,4-benzoquinol methylase
MICYLCESASFSTRKGQVRDAPNIKILECNHCGLVTLSSLMHIQSGFYEESGMHGSEPMTIAAWLKNTDWDDQRRFDMLKPILPNKKLLDFGCGAGGFMSKAQQLVDSVAGIELERRVREFWTGRITIHPDLESAMDTYDLIVAFHVIEHLHDPRTILKTLAGMLTKNGRIIIEVPSSEDALLTLYDVEAFQRFTYWSQHLFLFNSETLRRLVEQAGLRIITIQQYQRFPLSNHLQWLSKGKPGGHQNWSFLDSPALNSAYAATLASMGKCDTIIAHLEIDMCPKRIGVE